MNRSEINTLSSVINLAQKAINYRSDHHKELDGQLILKAKQIIIKLKKQALVESKDFYPVKNELTGKDIEKMILEN